MRKHFPILLIVACTILCVPLTAKKENAAPWDGTIVQFGTMHEAIGQQQSQGRVPLADVAKPGFYGIAALEGLAGEVTIADGRVTVTGVDDGALLPVEDSPATLQATLLAGAWVEDWKETPIDHGVEAAVFDRTIEAAATAAGIDAAHPFVFTVQGEFADLDFHVIHGACPMHARMRKIELPAEKSPYEGRLASISGTLVGLYASDSVGKLTHPDTSTHVHVIFEDPATGRTVTGHVESVRLAPGTVLRLPA